MPRFSFVAVAASGRKETGSVDADSRTDVLSSLAARGLTPLTVTSTQPNASQPFWKTDIDLGFRRNDLAETSGFLRSLSLLLKSGTSELAAIEVCAEMENNRHLKLDLAIQGLGEGASLSDALRSSETFPVRVVAALKAGEKSNKLADTAQSLADSLDREIAFRGAVGSALIYPVLLLIVSIVVVALLTFVLAPSLLPIFEAANAEPPWALSLMVSASTGLREHWGPILIGFASLAALGLLLSRLDATRNAWQALMLRLPLIGSTRRSIESARLFRTLAMQLNSGAHLVEALETTRETTTTSSFSEMLDVAVQSVASGEPTSTVFAKSALVPRPATQMLRIGEKSNRIAEMLDHAGELLELDVEKRTDRVLKLLTPIITVVVGVVVGGLVLSTMDAILSLNDLALR